MHYDALASKCYALADLRKVPADALMLLDSVTKQAAAHRYNITCKVDLKTYGLFCTEQRFGRGGLHPTNASKSGASKMDCVLDQK